jgi:hypothetical protein
MKHYNFTLLTLSLLFYFGLESKAQSYKISGKITYGEITIPFAHIIIEKSQFGAISNEEGFYKIENLTEGNYTVMVNALGYKKI